MQNYKQLSTFLLTMIFFIVCHPFALAQYQELSPQGIPAPNT